LIGCCFGRRGISSAIDMPGMALIIQSPVAIEREGACAMITG
jgi:hypothetical protein